MKGRLKEHYIHHNNNTYKLYDEDKKTCLMIANRKLSILNTVFDIYDNKDHIGTLKSNFIRSYYILKKNNSELVSILYKKFCMTRKIKVKVSPEFMVFNSEKSYYDPYLGEYCLDYNNDRVTKSSYKNFIIINEDGSTVLQFGKTGDNTFIMDNTDMLTTIQAFSICLSQF